MIGLAALFACYGIATRDIAGCARNFLRFCEVVVNWRWQIVPAKQDEATLASWQTRTLLHSITLAVNCDVVGCVDLGIERQPALHGRSGVVTARYLRQRAYCVAGINGQQGIEVTAKRVEGINTTDRCFPLIPHRGSADIIRMIWFRDFFA